MLRNALFFLFATLATIAVITNPSLNADASRLIATAGGAQLGQMTNALVILIYGAFVFSFLRPAPRRDEVDYDSIAEGMADRLKDDMGLAKLRTSLEAVTSQLSTLEAQDGFQVHLPLDKVRNIIDSVRGLDSFTAEQAKKAITSADELIEEAMNLTQDGEGYDRDLDKLDQISDIIQKLAPLGDLLRNINLDKAKEKVSELSGIADDVSSLCEDHDLDDLQDRLENVTKIVASMQKLAPDYGLKAT